ncbi:hypothetical protein [Paraburkholderia caribensis]|uniref:hypothetical protein n=2 Tax=Paraburkholderia TaxID=1822464 RepID=UPI001CAFBCD8|nr:hypothetical protein [Paraburkholderia caribensis]CAG9242851.1 conserved exported hypothetical protein [Paraburkholderia caribensis]
MKKLQKALAFGLISSAVFFGSAHAEGIGRSGTYLTPPTWEMIDHLPNEQKAKVIEIEQKMMHMEMDYKQAISQMEMRHAQEMMQMETELLNLFKGR